MAIFTGYVSHYQRLSHRQKIFTAGQDVPGQLWVVAWALRPPLGSLDFGTFEPKVHPIYFSIYIYIYTYIYIYIWHRTDGPLGDDPAPQNFARKPGWNVLDPDNRPEATHLPSVTQGDLMGSCAFRWGLAMWAAFKTAMKEFIRELTYSIYLLMG